MAAESKVSANAVIPNAARSDSAYLTAMGRITPQITAKLQFEDVLATIHHGLVEEFHAAFARLWLLGPATSVPPAIRLPTVPIVSAARTFTPWGRKGAWLIVGFGDDEAECGVSRYHERV
jgi:hypothetical protein